MTALAKDRTGIDISDEDLDTLRSVSDYTTAEEVKNKLSGRTEKRTTYFKGGLDICTVVKEAGKVVEIQRGLANHPIVSKLI